MTNYFESVVFEQCNFKIIVFFLLCVLLCGCAFMELCNYIVVSNPNVNEIYVSHRTTIIHKSSYCLINAFVNCCNKIVKQQRIKRQASARPP